MLRHILIATDGSEQTKNARAVLSEAKQTLKSTFPDVLEKTQLKKGNVAIRSVEAPEDEDIDIIMVGSRGHSGLSSLLLGSVSNYVVNHCKKPVLVKK